MESPVTLLNLYHPVAAKPLPERFVQEVGDGCNLRHLDQSFAIAYSNSVIEHLAHAGKPATASPPNSAAWVGRCLCKHPDRKGFNPSRIFVTAFIHFLPWRVAQETVAHLCFRGLFRSGDNMDTKKLATELRLLNCRGNGRRCFPDCEIHREKWLGLTKSIIAVRRSA